MCSGYSVLAVRRHLHTKVSTQLVYSIPHASLRLTHEVQCHVRLQRVSAGGARPSTAVSNIKHAFTRTLAAPGCLTIPRLLRCMALIKLFWSLYFFCGLLYVFYPPRQNSLEREKPDPALGHFIVTRGEDMWLKMVLNDGLLHADLHPVCTAVARCIHWRFDVKSLRVL